MERASNARPAQSESSANPAPRAISSAARAEIAGSSLILRTSHGSGFSPIGRWSSWAGGSHASSAELLARRPHEDRLRETGHAAPDRAQEQAHLGRMLVPVLRTLAQQPLGEPDQRRRRARIDP